MSAVQGTSGLATVLSPWLEALCQLARANRLAHVDLLLDATGVAELPAAAAEQPCALLFTYTPEQALAEQGPHLRRFRLDDPQHLRAADTLITTLGPDRLLALLSNWPFEPLAQHLRHNTQATWGRDKQPSGVFRYYDPRLFRVCSETLLPAQAEWFHAPVIAWYWRDGSARAQELAGRPQRPTDVPAPLPPLHLSDDQLFDLVAWCDAIRFCEDHALSHRDLQLSSQESLNRHLVSGLRAAQRERIADAGRDDFLLDWLQQQNPTLRLV